MNRQDDPKDRARFGRLMLALHASLGGDIPDKVKLDTYWTQLHVYDWSVLDKSHATLLRTRSKRDGFPSIGDWIACARTHHVEELRIATRASERSWQDDCQRCGDTGFEYFSKATGLALDEPPAGSHALYVTRPCACRASNATYRRRHGHHRVGDAEHAHAPSQPVRPRRSALERFDAGIPPERVGPTDRHFDQW
jgi:hypothetical protein